MLQGVTGGVAKRRRGGRGDDAALEARVFSCDFDLWISVLGGRLAQERAFMDIEPVRVWLKRTLRAAMVRSVVGMIGSLLGGLVVLWLSFWAAYGVIWFLSYSFFPVRHRTMLLLTGVFMAVVVIVGAKQNREQLDPLERNVQLARDMDIKLTPWSRYGMSYRTNAVKAGAFEVRSLAYLVNYILCGGVLLVIGSVRGMRRFRRLKAVEVEGCAPVITLLVAAGRRQSFTEIVEKLPGLNPVKVFDDLHWIEGVLFLSSDPPGLTLLPELRTQLTQRLTGG